MKKNTVDTVDILRNDEPYTVFEGMTSLSALFHAKDSGNNDRPVYQVLFDREKKSKKLREYRFLQAKAEQYGFLLTETESSVISGLTTGNSHGGVVALCGDRSLAPLTEACISPNGFYVMLEGIEDPYNFGYSIRSLYAAGVTGIILSERNWLSAAGTVARSSAGTSELMDFALAEPVSACEQFRKSGYQILCAGIRDSVSVFDETFRYPIFLIVGGEKRGISASLLSMADRTLRIDYGRCFKGSLSTASSAAVLAFELMRQNRNNDTNQNGV